jgi:hypothetical protein
MRRICLAAAAAGLCAVLVAGRGPAEQPPHPDAIPAEVLEALRARINPEYANWSPDQVVERCAEHLATVNAADRCRIRYLDASDVPRGLLPTAAASLGFGCPSASRASTTYVPRPVPNTDERIYWIDLGWYNWTAEVWESISQEDPYFREPIVSSANPGLHYLKAETLANPVVRASWLLYYAYDNSEFLGANEVLNDKAFYYQLVYANVEFEREVVETAEAEEPRYEDRAVAAYDSYGRLVHTTQRVQVSPGRAKSERKVKKKVKGVAPANVREFQQTWRIDFDALKDYPIDRGAMVDTGRSGVSYENRVIWAVPAALGWYWRTYDVFRTAGDQDFVESPFPKKFDAGEHIFQDRRGAQHYLLSNAKDETVDFGDPRAVKDHVSGARVLVTAWSCIHCHNTGILSFRNEHLEAARSGVRLHAVTPDRAERFGQFFLQPKKMDKIVRDNQDNYTEFVAECNGLTPAENVEQFGRFRAWYRRAVTLEQAARELGCTREELSDAVGHVGTKGRLGRLVLDGHPIPRQTWERGLYQEAGLLLLAWRKYAKMK